jgi:hypothetical protein
MHQTSLLEVLARTSTRVGRGRCSERGVRAAEGASVPAAASPSVSASARSRRRGATPAPAPRYPGCTPFGGPDTP